MDTRYVMLDNVTLQSFSNVPTSNGIISVVPSINQKEFKFLTLCYNTHVSGSSFSSVSTTLNLSE